MFGHFAFPLRASAFLRLRVELSSQDPRQECLSIRTTFKPTHIKGSRNSVKIQKKCRQDAYEP